MTAPSTSQGSGVLAGRVGVGGAQHSSPYPPTLKQASPPPPTPLPPYPGPLSPADTHLMTFAITSSTAALSRHSHPGCGTAGYALGPARAIQNTAIRRSPRFSTNNKHPPAAVLCDMPSPWGCLELLNALSLRLPRTQPSLKAIRCLTHRETETQRPMSEQAFVETLAHRSSPAKNR